MLFINATLFTMNGPPIESGYIHVENGKIAAVGSMSGAPKAGGEVLDCTGLRIYPGWIDAHSHIGMFGDGVGFESEDTNEDNDPCTPQLRAVDGCNPLDRCFSEALSWGITTVVTGPGSANPISGQLIALKTAGRRIDDMLLREPAGMKFSMGENPKMVYHGKAQVPSTRMTIAAIIREQLMKAQRYAQAVEDAENDEELEKPDYDAKCEALIPVLSREIKAYFHAHRADDIFTALRIAEEFNLDPVIIHGTEGHIIAKELGEMGVSVIAGPIICAREKPELRSATTLNPGILSKNGVKVAICTDHPVVPSEYLAMSAAICAANGLPEEEALKALTVTAAQIGGMDDRVGSIAVGKDADLLIFDGSPLGVCIKPRMVYVNGERML